MSLFRFLALSGILSLGLIVGCSNGDSDNDPMEESPDADACEHLTEGPFVSVTPTETAVDDNNAVFAAEHTAYRVNTAGAGEFTRFGVSEAGEYFLYVNSDSAVINVWEDDGSTAVTVEESITTSAECDEVQGRYTFDFEVANYYLQVQDQTASEVIVYLFEAEHEHDHEDEDHDHNEG